MRRNVYYIPSDRPFLKTLAENLLARTADHPELLSAYRVFLPTRRAVRQMVDTFLDLRQGRPLLLPRLSAIGDIDDEELALLVADTTGEMPIIPPAITAAARLLMLTELVRMRDQNLDYSQATMLAESLATLLDQIADEGLDLDRLDHLVPNEFAVHWQQVLNFLDIIRTHWPAILTERGLVEKNTRRNLLLRMLADFWRDHPPENSVIVAGVTGSLPAVANLMGVISSCPSGEIILSGFSPHIPDEEWENIDDQHPYLELKKLLEHLDFSRGDVRPWGDMVEKNSPRVWFWRQVMLPSSCADVWQNYHFQMGADWRQQIDNDLRSLSIFEADSLDHEALAVAMVVRKTIMDPEKTIAVVTPDRDLAQGIRQACARFGIQINDSAGQILSETSIGLFLRLILQVAVGGLHPVDVLALLRHPFFTCEGSTEAAIEKLDKYVLRGIRPRSDPDEFLFDVRQKIAGKDTETYTLIKCVVDAIRPLLSRRRALSDWGRDHIYVAETLCHRDDRGASILWQDDVGVSASRIMVDLLYAPEISHLSLLDYVALIERHFDAARVYSPRLDHPRVSLLGVYESRLSVADHVVLAGFNEDTWPRDAVADPWFSRAMRADFGLPSHEVNVGRMAFDFLQLALAGQMTITRTRMIDGATMTPSRWLQRLDVVLQGMGYSPEKFRDKDLFDWVCNYDLPERVMSLLKRPEPCPPLLLRPHSISVSTFEKLITNPYEVYAKQILELSSLNGFDAEFGAADIGNLIHAVLEKFISEHCDALSHKDSADLYSLLEHELKLRLPDMARQRLIYPRLKQILSLYFDKELSWRATGAQPWLRESDWHMKVKVRDKEFMLHARLDRIDRGLDGRVVIFDYKTGSVPTYKSVEQGLAPQIPLQVMIVEMGQERDGARGGGVAQAGFWELKNRVSAHRMWEDGGKYDIQTLRETTMNFVSDVLERYLDPTHGFPSWPDIGLPAKKSDYDYLARVAEWKNSGDAESEDEVTD